MFAYKYTNSKSFVNEFYESSKQFKICYFELSLWHYNKRDKVVNKLSAISHVIKFNICKQASVITFLIVAKNLD